MSSTSLTSLEVHSSKRAFDGGQIVEKGLERGALDLIGERLGIRIGRHWHPQKRKHPLAHWLQAVAIMMLAEFLQRQAKAEHSQAKACLTVGRIGGQPIRPGRARLPSAFPPRNGDGSGLPLAGQGWSAGKDEHDDGGEKASDHGGLSQKLCRNSVQR